MPIAEAKAPWTRKHDLPGVPTFASATIKYPVSLAELIELCTRRNPSERLRAAGSHWALSPAAFSDGTFIETHDPNNVFPAMGRTLRDVVPGCLTSQAITLLAQIARPFDPSLSEENPTPYFVHIETGKKVYQLYAELDVGDDGDPKSLARVINDHHGNPNFLGPWAFATLGGAGGQTVFGALTTGTHGGDIRLPPIANSVQAIHLVADGARHFWIEPERLSWLPRIPGLPDQDVRFTDDAKLTALYGQGRFGATFQMIRDDSVFNAVLVSPGRFGIVYSIVLRAVRQYALHEERRLADWQDIKNAIRDPTSSLYNRRFLQIAVNVAPHSNGTRNRCGITKRWNVALSPGGTAAPLPGRVERVGRKILDNDTRLNAPLFENAGNSFPFNPAGSGGFFEKACSNADFVVGIIDGIVDEVEDFVSNNAVAIGGGLAAAAAVGGAGLVALIPALVILLALLKLFQKALKASGRNTRLGQVLDELRGALLDQPTPERRAAGILIWRAIAMKLFESQQGNHDYEAISYAVMDGHDYFDKRCNVNVNSVEVFFDVTSANLIAFVDRLLKFESDQEFLAGKACVGYISLRFMSRTRALIGPEQHALTCAVEVAALKDVAGSGEMVAFATALALDRNINGILHWGQRNDSTMADIQHRFGDKKNTPGGLLGTWRRALSRITDNGRLDGFSSAFTRRVGLEIVTPRIENFTAEASVGQSIVARWDCSRNPPGTMVQIDVVGPSGQIGAQAPLDREGQLVFPAFAAGAHALTLRAAITLNGETRETQRALTLAVT